MKIIVLLSLFIYFIENIWNNYLFIGELKKSIYLKQLKIKLKSI